MSWAGHVSSVKFTDVDNSDCPLTPHSLDSAFEHSQPHSFTSSNIEIYQRPPDEVHLQPSDSSSETPAYLSSSQLLVDERDHDYYIVSHVEANTIAEHVQPDATKDATLFTRFSRPVDDQSPHDRYLRCSNTQLADFVAWMSEQQQDPTVVPGSQSPVSTDQISPLTNDEKALCQRQLVSVFQLWTPGQQRLAAMTLYCAANSIREFGIPELIAAVKIGMRITSKTAEFVHDNDQVTTIVESCINSLSQTILAQKSGIVVFKNQAMKPFIRQLNLPHLQAGHSLMSRICFEQIKQLGAALIIQPWYRFQSWFHSMSDWPLVGYVVRNWFLHYRMTADRADLDSELYYLLREALLVEMPQHPSILLERRIVDAGYGISQIYHLPGLEAVLRNMGARTALAKTSVLGKVITKTQWGRMNRMPDYKISSNENMKERAIATSEDNDDGFIIVHLEELTLSSEVTTDNLKPPNTCDVAAASPAACVDLQFVRKGSDAEQSGSIDTEMVDEA